MSTVVVLKSERKTIDPIATAQAARNRHATELLNDYRDCVFAAAAGDDFDVERVGEILTERNWSAEIWASDLQAVKDDLSQRSFLENYDRTVAELERKAANPPVVEIRIDLLSALFRKAQNPNATLLDIPKEITAALREYRETSPALQIALATMRVLKMFHGRNKRLFAADAQAAIADTRPSLSLEQVSQLANSPAGMGFDDFTLPARHPLAER